MRWQRSRRKRQGRLQGGVLDDKAIDAIAQWIGDLFVVNACIWAKWSGIDTNIRCGSTVLESRDGALSNRGACYGDGGGCEGISSVVDRIRTVQFKE